MCMYIIVELNWLLMCIVHVEVQVQAVEVIRFFFCESPLLVIIFYTCFTGYIVPRLRC